MVGICGDAAADCGRGVLFVSGDIGTYLTGAAGSLSRVRTLAAARRCPVRQDRGRRSPPACGRARTRRDCRAGCRATLDTHPGGRAGCVPPRASAAVTTGGRAAFGTAPAVAAPCGAGDNAAVVARWSTPWSSAHRYVTGRDLTAHGAACVVGGSVAEAPRRRLFSMAVRRR